MTLFILLWLCGSLILLSVIAKLKGELTGGDVLMGLSLSWLFLPALLIVGSMDVVLWKRSGE